MGFSSEKFIGGKKTVFNTSNLWADFYYERRICLQIGSIWDWANSGASPSHRIVKKKRNHCHKLVTLPFLITDFLSCPSVVKHQLSHIQSKVMNQWNLLSYHSCTRHRVARLPLYTGHVPYWIILSPVPYGPFRDTPNVSYLVHFRIS